MSLTSIQGNIERLQRDISDLQAKLSRATKKESDATGKIARIQSSMSGRLFPSQYQSKLRELSRVQDDVAKARHEQSDLNKKIADKTRDLHRYQGELSREEERERKKLIESDRRRQQELVTYNRSLDSQLAAYRLTTRLPGPVDAVPTEAVKPNDFFISHASEDKDEFVRPLVEALQRLGVTVWYDEFQLKVGDSLRRSIDKGLSNSRYGVVVLSSMFFAKDWPQQELDGMFALEVNGRKVILPIWHRVTKDEVLKYSPILADKVALQSSLCSTQEIAEKLAEIALDGKGDE